jgi:hypothetical protein
MYVVYVTIFGVSVCRVYVRVYVSVLMVYVVQYTPSLELFFSCIAVLFFSCKHTSHVFVIFGTDFCMNCVTMSLGWRNSIVEV